MLSRVQALRKMPRVHTSGKREGFVQVLKETAADADTATHKKPAHAHVYTALRARVQFGDLIPGQAVTLHGLSRDLNAGMTPVREAVRRLISDGALAMQGNRRVILPELTDKCIQQIEFLRLSIEPELLRRAIDSITADRIDALDKQDCLLNQAISRGDIAGYLRHNYEFHRTLYAFASSPIVAATVDSLWLRFGPSLRVVCGRFGTLNLPDRHAELLQALRQQDAVGADAALRADICQGMNQMRSALAVKAEPRRFD